MSLVATSNGESWKILILCSRYQLNLCFSESLWQLFINSTVVALFPLNFGAQFFNVLECFFGRVGSGYWLFSLSNHCMPMVLILYVFVNSRCFEVVGSWNSWRLDLLAVFVMTLACFHEWSCKRPLIFVSVNGQIYPNETGTFRLYISVLCYQRLMRHCISALSESMLYFSKVVKFDLFCSLWLPPPMGNREYY